MNDDSTANLSRPPKPAPKEIVFTTHIKVPFGWRARLLNVTAWRRAGDRGDWFIAPLNQSENQEQWTETVFGTDCGETVIWFADYVDFTQWTDGSQQFARRAPIHRGA